MIATVIAGLLAQQAPRDTGPDFGKAAPFGLLIVVLLLVGVFVLVWSMNRHLRNLPASFDDDEASDAADVTSAKSTDVVAEPIPDDETPRREPG